MVVFRDVTKERRLKRALSFQASHDALTGLINRREFDNRLTQALQSARDGEGRTRCCTSIWISSRWSTTPAVTRPATGCCAT